MQEMMRVIGGDFPPRSLAGNLINAVDLGTVMIHHHHQGGLGGRGRRRRGRAPLRRPAGVLQEVPQVDHLRTAEILRVRLMHHVMLSCHVEGEFAAVPAEHRPYFLHQRKHIPPLEIVRGRMPEQGFERAKMCAV